MEASLEQPLQRSRAAAGGKGTLRFRSGDGSEADASRRPFETESVLRESQVGIERRTEDAVRCVRGCEVEQDQRGTDCCSGQLDVAVVDLGLQSPE